MGVSTSIASGAGRTEGTTYFVGRDENEHWVARDLGGLHGGIFTSRQEAIRFARFETGRRPDGVVAWPEQEILPLTGRLPLARRGRP